MRVDGEPVAAYLAAEGVVPGDATVSTEPLGGGVSNDVVRVSWDDDALVAKRPLGNLDVEDDWPADVDRVHNEAAAARVFGDVLSHYEISGVETPEVRFEDRENHVIAITAAPSSARMWKADLLEGRVEAWIGETLGDVLAKTHDYAAGDEAVENEFSNYAPFEQLRLEPYHETVAERHPDVATPVLAERDRLGETRETLVHGDFSPKNVLVDEAGRDTTLWLLDFEVAHWGDPVFDAAFVLNHLFIKSVYNAERRDEYVSTAEAFWGRYAAEAGTDRSFESNVVDELAVLMLARVDGKSPVEYVRNPDTKARLRSIAKAALTTDVSSLAEFVALLRSEVEVP